MAAIPIPVRSAAARGMTLMEVLIACGILVLGLSSIAALLPAAGARLGQANLEDRAATLAANAYTDVVSRKLTSVELFTDPAKSLAFGKGLADVPGLGVAGQWFAAPQRPIFDQRIDAERGFLLEDEILFTPAATAATPANQFESGRRAFKEGLCWGASLVPVVQAGQVGPPSAQAGSPARLSIAVFRKQPQAAEIPLEVKNGVYQMATPNETLMKTFLKSCSHVLVPFQDATRGPRWFRITASWIAPIDPVTRQRSDPNCYVIFDDSAEETFGNFAGSTPTVIGFDGIVRLDEYNVILE